jgi:hypothetical protein
MFKIAAAFRNNPEELIIWFKVQTNTSQEKKSLGTHTIYVCEAIVSDKLKIVDFKIKLETINTTLNNRNNWIIKRFQ